MNQKQTADALRAERKELTDYLEKLPEGAWDKQSLCGGWRVRDVVAHLVGNAADLVARNLEGMGSVEFNQRQVDERSDKSPSELLAEWAEQGPLFEDSTQALDDEFWNTPYPPFATIGEALERLVEDLWVHAQDIRIPLGEEVTRGPGLKSTLDCAVREYPERMPRLAPEVGTIDVNANGYKQSVSVNGGGVTVRISGDDAMLALAVTGRTDLETAISEGKLKVEPAPPSGFAEALNIYAP